MGNGSSPPAGGLAVNTHTAHTVLVWQKQVVPHKRVGCVCIKIQGKYIECAIICAFVERNSKLLIHFNACEPHRPDARSVQMYVLAWLNGIGFLLL